MRDAWLHFVSWKVGGKEPAPAHGAVAETGEIDRVLSSDGATERAQRDEWLAAARQEHARALQMLLDAGASLKAADSEGDNSIMLAVKAGSAHAVELLVAENTLRHRSAPHVALAPSVLCRSGLA